METAGDSLDAAPPRAIATGDRLGPYEIVALLGGGGMGDVYRATDTRLARTVAVKVLRDGLTSADARARFVREARAIAAVSHGNIISIFDVGEQAGVPYLVTELLAGETLRARLARDRPALADALAWARQIAHGLAAAHDRGIVHRDLKPENIMLLDGGGLKILDFGLARSTSIDAERDISTPGVIIGTIGYLAPEHARGKPATASSDLFALGAILYELATGKRAFDGETAVDTLRAVLDRDPPPPSSLRPEVPASLDRVIARCLAKDPANRFESARDLAFALESPGDAVSSPPEPRRTSWLVPWLAALALGIATIVLLVHRTGTVTGVTEAPRPYPLTYSGSDRHPAVSPDGKLMAFTSDRNGRRQIWVQTLATGREVPITDGPDTGPRFSPDGSQVLFTRGDLTKALYRSEVVASEPRIARLVANNASDGDWSPDGRRVVFVRPTRAGPRTQQSLVLIDIDGTNERVVADLEDRVPRGRDAEQRVRWSPDGKRIALSGYLRHPGIPQAVTIVTLDGAPAKRLPTPSPVGMVSAVAWEDARTLVYAQATSVSANSTGSAARIIRQDIETGASATLWWSLESGVVLDRWPGRGFVYDVRSTRQNLRELDLTTGESRALSSGMATDRQPVLTPDGSKILFSTNRGGTTIDVWVTDRRTGVSSRLTDHPAEDYDPAVSPDGRSLIWSSNRAGGFDIWMANIDGTNPRQITHDGNAENGSMTPDGKYILYASGGTLNAGLWRVRVDGGGATKLAENVILPEISPDGIHVLFLSNGDPARPTIRVARIGDGEILPFEIPVERRVASSILLGRARWHPDGGSIAFVAQDPQGRMGVYLQKFDCCRDTAASRMKIAESARDVDIESFDLDANTVVLAEAERRSQIIAVTNLGKLGR